MIAERRLRELGIELPPAPVPVAMYVPVLVHAGTAFVSGQVPLDQGRPMWTGKLGADVSLEEGVEAARRCGLQVLAALRAELGTLDRVIRILRVTVFVASAQGFVDQPKVANGASELFAEVLGDAGRHARAAVGVAELPLGAPVEVEAAVAVSG